MGGDLDPDDDNDDGHHDDNYENNMPADGTVEVRIVTNFGNKRNCEYEVDYVC